jgi:hypothetical protein
MTRWSFDPPLPEEELVTVRIFKSEAEYSVARSALESAGIECFSTDKHATNIHTHLNRPGVAGSIALQVRKADAEDALAILDAPPLDENCVIEE